MGARSTIRYCYLVCGLAVHLNLACGVASGFTVYLQDLGTDFVPTAGNEWGHLVGYRLSTNQAAWRAPDGELVDLGTLGGAQSRATAISDDATSIVGWAHNNSGVQNAFRFENGNMTTVLATSSIANQAVGLDSENNIYLNRQSAPTSVMRHNRVSADVDTLLTSAQATGVNSSGTMVGKTTSGMTFRFSGSISVIQPSSYNPVAGIGDTGLTAGSLGDHAAFHQPGGGTAQNIPGIAALGSTSTATGVNDGVIVGNTAATAFHYSLTSNTLTDLNTGTFEGVDALYILKLHGITDADIFFGQYIDQLGVPRYFRGSLAPVDFDSIPGDFDQDGDVDGRDFLTWQRNPAVGALAAWRANYGVGALSELGHVNAVPEPLAGFVLLGVLAARRPLKRTSPQASRNVAPGSIARHENF